RALEILRGVAAGLAALHSVGIGHLDVKPSNVVLRDRAEPVLVDFGLAGRHIRPWFSTPAYGAPEIWRDTALAAKSDPAAADIYSFGCVAYELLIGKALFDGPSQTAIIALHQKYDGGPESVQKLWGRGHGDIAALIRACLRRDPTKRVRAAVLGEALSTIAKR